MVISNNAELKSKMYLQFNSGTRLYKLHQQEKKLTRQVIKYLQGCFAYALHQNKENSEGVHNAVLNIVQHAYGEHGQCGDWCQFRKDPLAKYKSLPGGLALAGDSLRLVLNNVFASYPQNAEKLASCGSTPANESFNNSVATKAPTERHCSGSESLDSRVKAAACQKNSGHSYVSEVCLSPGTVTSRRGIELNNKGKKWIRHYETKEAQRRRIHLKEERSTRQYQTKVREGDTYESDIGLWHSSDIQEIRPPVTTAQNQNLMTVISTAKIMFDVETTSLATNADIIQLSAVHGHDQFNTYIIPEKEITPGASQVTHLAVVGGRLCPKGKPVDSKLQMKASRVFWSG
ncbi:PREDICTED: uncharacterized protein LOC107356771 [Acropora digitifera]|uniref:uncharacterized protein LOC107356771 n=1 Tax=Acropora digitifera TaxID=70779 RepID=UPI00077AF5A1|nr:PREDICTED: uncharacterized protein LOC107356771 [Acropora digitifera]